MTYEFLWTSMHGAQWIPCVFMSRNNLIDEVTIRYFDDFIGGWVEASVESDCVRIVEQQP
jgi:hypothetical protein